MSKTEILSLFDEWNGALQTGDSQVVASLYESDAVLLPTISNQVRYNTKEIADYFVQFLANNPIGKIDECNIRVFDQIAINSGVYTFTFNEEEKVQARFTFIYRWNGTRWMIIEHHSSRMPEMPELS
ncbi:SgcJ/EcaC family oxidoreductase [Aestuariirhabdus sp. Z084]|uniref:SgcJ/EcaC family oxidoreductase n=1 Tax=Aestuariirhabdus haliotis TaxID=2918751 RepID=UPI00201B3755|nr:SgcJ/EcaC family oxidoreductase [Aestuariirhabdus haliotis]MCL6414817.1 SgcJ/EcaC family oxidoreductase [Aestuariirhabdus haliotis]MCL6418749.1 SgcJ/EcaC family oxidoreductase [Aestuariirhabdus haliotis]